MPSPPPLPTTAMAATAHTDTASGPLMLMLTTDSATAHTDMASAPLMPRLTTDSATAHTDTARGPLTLTTDMAATAPTDTASKLGICSRGEDTSGINQNYTLKPKVPRTDMIREFCNLLHETKINFYTSW